MAAQLLTERPPVTVDEDGGSFFSWIIYPGTHTLVSWSDHTPGRSFNRVLVQRQYHIKPLVHPPVKSDMRQRTAWNHQNPTFTHAQGGRFSRVIPRNRPLMLVGLSLNPLPERVITPRWLVPHCRPAIKYNTHLRRLQRRRSAALGYWGRK